MKKLIILRTRFVQMFFGSKVWGFPVLNRVRKSAYRGLLHLGHIDVIGNNVQFVTPHNIIGSIKVGDHTDLCDGAYIDYTGDVEIGNNVTISRRTTIYSHGHDFQKLACREGGDVLPGFVKINDGVWIGDGVIILPNTVIGKYSVIGAGSIVTKDVPEYAVVAGNPAKFIRDVKDEKLDCK